jgi:putative membrane protein
MMWWGDGVGAWGYALMAIGMVVLWALIIVGIVVLVRYLGRGGVPERGSVPGWASPEEVLARRFAAGEIDEREYRDRLEVLRGRGRSLTMP